MGTSIFNIGVSGLNAAQAGLLTSGHNVANANTPGYSRQQIVQATNFPLQTGSGFFGQGVNVTTVRRIYDQFLANQVMQAQTTESQLDAYYSQIQQLDNLFGDPAAGLAPALQDFFSGVQGLASNPASVPSRQAVLSSAQALASRFQGLESRLSQIRDGVNSQVEASVALINSYSQQIARLNESIMVAQSGTGQPPNDLLDQRDALVASLNQEIKATVVRQDNGSYNVFIGNGQALVTGNQAYSLKAVPDPADPTKLTVAYGSGGTATPLKEDLLEGGKLGGYLQFRTESLDPAENALGRIALVLAKTFNNQHKLGQDLNGSLGTDFFNVASPRVQANSNNSGSAVISAALGNVGNLTGSDYQLKYDGTNYILTRLSDGTVQTFSSLPQTVDGVTLSLASGTPAAGDSFLIRPTVNGARDFSVLISDPAKIAAATPIRTAVSSNNTGNATISAGVVNAPPPPDPNLQQPVTFVFNNPPTTFNVTGTGTGNPTNVSYTSGSSISYNGWTVQIAGQPQAGDTFTIGPNTGGVSDNRNALLLAGLQTQNTVGNGASYQSAYAQLVSQVGNKTRELQVTSQAQANLVSQTVQAQQAVSGVNLDEEAANLMRYQQAYQASGKVMQIASRLFDTLLSLGG